MKLSAYWRWLFGLLVLVWLPWVNAFRPPEENRFPNFDQRIEINRKAKTAALALSPAPAPPPEVRVERDELLGTPKFILARDGFLTGPNGLAKGAKTPAALVAANDPHGPVKAFLARNAAWLQHGPEILNTALVQRDYVTKHDEMRTVVWQQQVEGVDVFGGVLIGHVTKRGELAALSSQVLPNAEKAITTTPALRALFPQPPISAAQAVALAAHNVGEPLWPENHYQAAGDPVGADARQFFRAPNLRGDTRARLVWLPITAANFRLCWEVIFTGQAARQMFRTLVDAANGEVLVRHSLTKHASPATYRVYISDSPTPMSPGHLRPSSQQPPEAPRQLVRLYALNTNASPNGWILEGGTNTLGNNVDAHLDRNGDDQPDLPRPAATNLVFDFALSLTNAPASYGEASVVNLFYWCNVAHDKLYELGFTETAGNFQTDNFNRGGQGNDAVQADCQDGDGYNNANFSAPPDGLAGRMQMFIFTGPNPRIDGSLDAEIILHEYAHGLSERLVGGGQGINTLQSAGLAEGWSDLVAMALLSEPDDDLGGNYPFSAYAARKFGGLNENYYYGIRRYPYSTNFAKNPLTFKDIDPDQASPHAGVPRSPAIATGAAEVHSQGEVWCSMLWDMRANLIRKHGFETGNRLALQLVVDGMRLAPPNPNFINARDAILMADFTANEFTNRTALWSAFARRGLGLFATSPAGSTTRGVREDFSTPDDLSVMPPAGFTANGALGGPFAPDSIQFLLVNTNSSEELPWVASCSGLLELSAMAGTLPPRGTTTVMVTFSPVVTALPPGLYTDTIHFINLTAGISQPRTITVQVGQEDFLFEVFDQGDFDLQYSTLTFTPDATRSGYRACRQSATNFPTNPTGGRVVTMGDDWYVPIVITNGGTVAIFGERTNVFYISSNGQLALRQGNTNYFEPEYYVFYEQTRAAALYCDLHPGQGGKIVSQQLPERIAVTWLDVPEFGISNSNSFQIELFFDGTIRMTWLRVDARGYLAEVDHSIKVGVSAGKGVPQSLQESDFSSYQSCAPPIALSLPADGREGQGTLPNAGRVTIPYPSEDGVVVVGLISSDTNKLIVPPTVSVPLGQTQALFAVTYADNNLRDGAQVIRVTATATGYNSGRALVVVNDNEPVTLSLALPAVVNEGEGLLVGQSRVIVSEAPDRTVLVRLSTSDTNLVAIPLPAHVILPAGQTSAVFDLQVLDNTTIQSQPTVQVRAEVGGWQSASATLTVRDNEGTNLTLQLPASVGENFGTVSNAGRVFVQGTMGSDLTVVLNSSDPAKLQLPATVTIPAGQNSASISWTVTDDTEINGPRPVTITASAQGFGSTNIVVMILDDEVPGQPYYPMPGDNATNAARLPILAWLSGVGELAVNGNFETGNFSGWTNEYTENGCFIINNGAFVTAGGEGPYPPLAGNYDALSQQSGYGKRTLWQPVAVPCDAAEVTLSWRDRIRNFAAGFSTNQQFRVEIRDSNHRTLAIPFITRPGDPNLQEVSTRQFNLNAWRGQTIHLAFVEEDTGGSLNVYLDDISVRAVPPAQTEFDLLLGRTNNLGPTNLLGATTDNYFTLTNELSPNTRYYWQVIARRGPATNASPVWSFVTQGTNPAPSLAFLAPTNNAIYYTPADIQLQVAASGSNGVGRVQFFIKLAGSGPSYLGEDTTAPFTMNWSAIVPGYYVFTALAYDTNGLPGNATDINVIVAPGGGAPVLLVPPASTWKYLDDGSDTGTAWRERGFDDTSWKTGQGQFGYGDGDETTVVDYGPDPNNKYITTYFRKTFTNSAELTFLNVKLLRDDGAVLWINGREALRNNMPFYSIISFNTRATVDVSGVDETEYGNITLNPIWLSNGVNTIAVEVHQFTNNSPDLSFDLSLEGIGNQRPSVTLTAPPPGATVLVGPLPITAHAFDSYGRITRVEFFANGQKIGEALQPPYTVIWTNTVPGHHELSAVATDNSGLMNTSGIVPISAGGPVFSGVAKDEAGLHFTWPSAAHDYLLEATLGLMPPNWQPVTNAVITNNGIPSITIPLDAAQRFFRLRKP